MKITSFLSWLAFSPIPRIAAVMLIAPACITPSFCGEIHDAARAGDLQKVKTMLKENPNLVAGKDNNGWTPLHLAVQNGHKEVVELLLANKAEVNAESRVIGNDMSGLRGGFTPLYLAAGKGNKDVVELLLAKGADANARGNTSGWTPLHLAAREGHREVAEVLLAHGADVNAKTNEGETPLHSVLKWTVQKDVLEFLLAKGADVNARDNNGMTPLQLAIFLRQSGAPGIESVVELLRRHGGHE